MRQTASLLWKEWHELRAYLVIGLGVFLGFPLVDAMEQAHSRTGRIEMSASPWVLTLGGVLAIFVGAGASCRDFNGRLEDFWRSRPVNPARWMLVKYLVGLLVVLVSCMAPLAVEVGFNNGDPFRSFSSGALLAWFPYLWAALYSVAFLAGCLTRRTAHSAMLALAAMLLVYCLPLVLPPLEWLNVGKVMDAGGAWGWEQVRFGAGMLGLAGASLVLALVAVRYDWRIESGQKMMYGSVSVALLILFASAAYQVGTNLPILQEVNLPAGEYVSLIRCDGRSGFVMTRVLHDNPKYVFWGYRVRKLQLAATGIELGEAMKTDLDPSFLTAGTSTWQHPEIAYYVTVTMSDGPKYECRLHAADFSTGEEMSLPRPWVADHEIDYWPQTFAWHNRLYLFGRHLAMYDITEPMSPRLISVTSVDYNDYRVPGLPSHYIFNEAIVGGDEFVAFLPRLPGVPLRERLIEAIKANLYSGHLEGDILFLPDYHGTGVKAYHLGKITDSSARFKKIGEYHPSLLESFLTSRAIGSLEVENGVVYLSPAFWRGPATNRGEPVNPNITVLDFNSRPPLRPVGHFAAPGAEIVCPLPDGRAIIGGTKLWLVGPPPRHSN